MSDRDRKKKDHKDVGKKRQRMRANVTQRKASRAKKRKSTDEVDSVKFKRGSAGDRTRSGAP